MMSNPACCVEGSCRGFLEVVVLSGEGSRRHAFRCSKCGRKSDLAGNKLAPWSAHTRSDGVRVCAHWKRCGGGGGAGGADGGGFESAEHALAAKKLMDWINGGGSIRVRLAECTTESHWPEATPLEVPERARAVLEKTHHGTRADVAVVLNGRIMFGLEVWHTHATVTPRPYPWFEFKAVDVIHSHTMELVDMRYMNTNLGCGRDVICFKCHPHMKAKYKLRDLIVSAKEVTITIDCGCPMKMTETLTVPAGGSVRLGTTDDVHVLAEDGSTLAHIQIQHSCASTIPCTYEIAADEVLRVADAGEVAFTCRRFWNRNDGCGRPCGDCASRAAVNREAAIKRRLHVDGVDAWVESGFSDGCLPSRLAAARADVAVPTRIIGVAITASVPRSRANSSMECVQLDVYTWNGRIWLGGPHSGVFMEAHTVSGSRIQYAINLDSPLILSSVIHEIGGSEFKLTCNGRWVIQDWKPKSSSVTISGQNKSKHGLAEQLRTYFKRCRYMENIPRDSYEYSACTNLMTRCPEVLWLWDGGGIMVGPTIGTRKNAPHGEYDPCIHFVDRFGQPNLGQYAGLKRLIDMNAHAAALRLIDLFGRSSI